MKKLSGVFLLVLIVAVSAGLGYFHLKNAEKKAESDFASNLETIEELKTLDASWSLAALTAYNTPQSNFDEVASFLPKVRALRAKLENSSLTAAEAPEAVKNKLLRFLLLVEGKEVAIEHFKSNFAVVRNSLKFLPMASQTLANTLRTSKSKKETIDELISLYDRTMAFLQTPDEGTKVRLLIDLSKVDENLMSFPPDIANPLGNFTSHARVLVERKIDLDTSVNRLVQQEVIKAGEELVEIYKTHQTEMNNTATAAIKKNSYIVLGLTGLLALLGIISAALLWTRDRNFDSKLALAIKEKTMRFEHAAAGADTGNVSVDAGQDDWYDIKLCVDNAVKLVQKDMPEGTSIDTELANTPELFGSQTDISQVFVNLLRNSGQAIAEAARDRGMIKVKTSVDNGRVMVSVMDNGIGFDDETRRKIFEGDASAGGNRGVAEVRRIVTAHGGKVMVKSVPNKGTNFVFVLPTKDSA